MKEAVEAAFAEGAVESVMGTVVSLRGTVKAVWSSRGRERTVEAGREAVEAI